MFVLANNDGGLFSKTVPNGFSSSSYDISNVSVLGTIGNSTGVDDRLVISLAPQLSKSSECVVLTLDALRFFRRFGDDGPSREGEVLVYCVFDISLWV